MKDEIFRNIKKHADFGSSAWHTPGHKGLLSRFDITEIDDSFPADSIEAAQRRVAEIYGVKAVRFLTGGSSIGIKAGLMSLPGDVLIEANCHRAVRDGLKLAGKTAVEIINTVKNGLPQPLSVKEISRALAENANIKTVVVTSPDYYGQTSNAKKIAKTVKEYGAYLYADAAHGAHFAFRRDLFPEGFTGIADICNISAHKTLPAFTQSAYLCINNESLIDKIDENLALLGTTSPSYLLLGGLEYAAEYCAENALGYDALFKESRQLKKDVKCLDNDDFTRIVIDAEYYGVSGRELYFRLKDCGIVCEKYDDRYVVLIITIADDKKKVSALREEILKTLKKKH